MGKKLRDEDLILNIIVNGNKGQKEMNDLEQAIKGTNKEIGLLEKKQKAMLAAGKNETAAYKAVTAAIKDKNASILVAENRLKELRKGMKITEMTSGDLKKELKDLNKWMDHTKPNTEAYKAYEERLQAVKDRLAELKPVAEETGFNLQDMANKFNHYIGVITAGILTFVGIISGLKQINQTFAEFDDKVADVQKTTGLAKNEVRELNEEFKKIDTRTQQEDLLGLAQVAGKLGIEGKEDILGFVKAADQISVALSEDLGGNVEDSINEIGKLVGIFSLKEEFGLEKSILKIGSTINELGASSEANEGYLVEFAKRVAGVAPAAGISIPNIMGLGAALDKLGQTAEVSGTAFNDLIPSMFKDTGTFASIAGMEVGKFTELLNTDANAALIKVLEGVKGNNASFGEMVTKLDSIGIDGSRATTVLSALAGKVGDLKEQQLIANTAFSKGTSITNEYNIKNSTAAANMDRAKKAIYNMTVELGEKLNPVMTGSTSLFVTMLKVLQVLVSFLIDYRKVIVPLVSALIAYNVVAYLTNKINQENILTTKLDIALKKINVFWINTQRASSLLLAATQALLTGNLEKSARAMRLFNLVVAANPIAALIAVVIAAGAALYMYSGNMTAAQKAQQALNETEVEAKKSIIAQKIEMERLLGVARDKTRSDLERVEAIRLLNELSPEHLGFLNLENINTEKVTSATNNYIESLLKVARVRAAQGKLQEIEEKRIDIDFKAKNPTVFDKFMSGIVGAGRLGGSQAYLSGASELENLTAEEKALKEYIERNEKKRNSATGQTTNTNYTGPSADEIKARAKYALEAKSQIDQEKSAHTDRLKEVGLFGKKRSELSASDLQALNDLEKIYNENIASINTKANKKALADQKKDDKEAKQLLKEQLAYQTEVITSQKTAVEQENIAHQDRLKKAGIDSKNVRKDQIVAFESLEKLHKSNLAKLDATAIEKHLDSIDKQYAEELRELRIKNNEELATIKTVEQSKAILKNHLSAKELDKIRNLEQAKKALKEKYDQDELKLSEEQLSKLTTLLKNALNAGDFSNLKLSDHIFSEDELKVLSERLGIAREKLAEVLGKEKPEGGESSANKTDYSFAGGKVDILGLTQDDWSLFTANLEAGKYGVGEITAAVMALSSAWSLYSEYATAAENRQLSQYEKGINQRKISLEKQLNSGKISQDRYSTEVKKIDEELDAKKAEIELKQAKRQKISAALNIAMSTAQAIMGIWAQVPKFDFGISAGVLTAIVAGIGAAQLATVLATPLPGKEEGGYLDVTRSQDNKRFRARNRPDQRGYIADPTVLVSENGKEFVANAEAVNNPTIRPMLDILDTAQRNGTINTLNLERMYSSRSRSVKGRQNGGCVSDRADSAGSNYSGKDSSRMEELLIQQIEINKQLIKRLEGPITAEVALTGRNGLNAKQAELQTLVKSATL